MNALDVLKYGHQTVLKSIDGLSEEDATVTGAVGVWSARDIIAHLASFEQVLAELLGAVLDPGQPTPTLDLFRTDGSFNDRQVEARRGKSLAELLDEYGAWHARVLELAARVPQDTLDREGTLPWYGAEYDLEDFIVYTFYGHKREHSAQIALFRKRLAQQQAQGS